MKYLVVYSGANSKDSTLCDNETEAVDTLERKLQDGAEVSDFEVFAAEPIEFNVERRPIVTFRNESPEVGSVDIQQVGSQVSELSESFDVRDDDKHVEEDPFSSEQVFSLDS